MNLKQALNKLNKTAAGTKLRRLFINKLKNNELCFNPHP